MNIRKASKKAVFLIIMTALIMSMAFTGCAERSTEATGDYYAESEKMMVEEAPAMEAEDGGFAVSEEQAYNDEAQYSDTATAVDRKVIKTAYLELEIGEGKFEKIVFDITRLAEKNGGFVSHTQSYSDSEGKLTSGSITIRIPHDQYNPALDTLKEMGTVKSISVSGQDVTQEYTDLESRLRNQEAQEEILLDTNGAIRGCK